MLEKGLQAMEIPAQLHITGKDAWEKNWRAGRTGAG